MSLPENHLRLFGVTELTYKGHTIDLARARLDELITYLAVRPGEACPRSQIAYAMWADSSEKQARTNLRNLIFNLKKSWPSVDSAIAIERSALCWRPDADVVIDVRQYQALLDEAERTTTEEDRANLLAQAASLYRGDLLPNCYEDWAMASRQRLHENCGNALAKLVDALLDLRRYDEALSWAKRLQVHDPLQESTYRRLMLSYLALHDRSAALRVYHVCADMLQKELGVEPSLATRQIVDRLLGQEIPESQPDDVASVSVPRPHLVGRQSEWQALLGQWRQAEAGQARMVMIQGEAGIGKTRLAEEMIGWVGRQNYAWASSRSYAAQGAIAYAPVAAWLRSPRIGIVLQDIDDLWRVEVHRLLPELAAERPDLPSPGSISEDWQRQRFYQAIVQTLRACPAPLLLHLDDLQWTDTETLAFLHYLLQSLPQHPLLVIGCARTEEMEINDALIRLRHDVRHSEQWAELSLGPLSAADVRVLAEQTAGMRFDDEAAEALYASSEGHPLLLIETIHADGSSPSPKTAGENHAHNGQLVGEEHGAMPVKVFSMMAHRLRQLSVPARGLAEVAAVIGRDFSFELLLGVGTADEGEVVEALDELWRRRIVRHQHDADYDFSHDRLREVAYQQISPPRRRYLHGRTARAMESLYQDQLELYAGQIAAHYERSGELAFACTYYGRAATFAVQQYALSSAERLYESALGLSDNVTHIEKLNLLQAQADLFQQTGKDPKVWSANLAEQDIIARSTSTIPRRALVRVYLHHAYYFQAADQYAESIRAAEGAIELAQVENDYDALARAHLVAGNACHATEVVTAGQHFMDAAHFAGLVGNRAIEARSLDDATITGMFTGVPYSKLLEYLDQAFDLARGLDDRLILTNLYNKLGIGPVLQGMSGAEEAEENLQRALSMARETGVRYTEKLVLGNLGMLYAHRGDYRMAVTHLQIATEIVDVGYSALRDGYLQHNLGLTYAFQGRLESAYQLLSDILGLLQRAKHVLGEARARSDLGFVLFLMGDYESSHDQVSAVLETARRLGDTRQEALDSVRLGYLEEARQRWPEATRAYRRGFEGHSMMEQHYYAMNALAGLARVARQQGDEELSYQRALTVWETMRGQPVDATMETTLTYRTCHEIFVDHQDLRAPIILETAVNQLQARAATIDELEHVKLFWQIPDHRYFQQYLDHAAPGG